MKPSAHILIIDDIPLNLELLGSALADDYDIQFATSGAQALALALVRQQTPALILLDVMMPGMDGHQVLRILKDDPATRDIPVILITAQNDSASETWALEAGAADFIHKPVNPPVVRARVRLQLELHQRVMASFETEQRLSESLQLVERALAEATALQARFHAIFDQAPLGIALIDVCSGQLFDCNERYAAIVGRSVVEACQRGCLNITHPDDQQRVQAAIDRLNAGEIPRCEINARFLLPDRSSVWTRRTMAPVQVDAGGTTLLLSMVEDITEQRETEQKLLDAKEAAEQSNRAKSAFVANMSHEVRTPMNAVLGFLDILADSSLDARQRTLLEKVQKSSRALLRILNDILDFSKLDAGAVDLEDVPFELDTVLRDATELLALTASAKGLELVLDVPPGLPQHYRGDALRLGQILLNLLGNAIKFTQQGCVRLAVRPLDQTDDGQTRLRFEVNDSGIGMRAEQIERLFQPFTQADNSTTRRFGGTGLGLTIVKRLVELMDGEIGVQSEPGQGATFWFTVPLTACDQAAAGQAGQRQRGLALPADGLDGVREAQDRMKRAESIRGARLLLVEDNPTNQEVARSLLGKMGLQVTVANHGREALDLLAGQRFDLVLMDLQMPVMDGFEATAAIRASSWGRQLPIVAMTAAAFADDRRRVLEAGMNDFVGKPVDSRQLLDTLWRWLPHRAPQEQPAQPEAVLFALAEAEQLLSHNRLLPVPLLERLRGHLGQPSSQARLQALTELMGVFDFEGALATLKAMRESLSGLPE